jgi:hypothetical protein
MFDTPDSPFDWRKHLPVHPAAELFPLMAEAELKELAEDIKANGIQTSIVLFNENSKDKLLDGRNRLDALVLLGRLDVNHNGSLCLIGRQDGDTWDTFIHQNARSDKVLRGCDPYAFVLSANAHRRHLTAEQKRDLIAKVLAARPESSDRKIAKQTKTDHKQVGRVRAKMEGRGSLPHVEMRTDSKGRKQPAKKPRPSTPTAPTTAPVIDDNSAEARKRHYTETEPAAARRGVTPPDDGLRKFDALVLELLRRTRRAPGRFAATAIPAGDLRGLGDFLHELAGIVARPAIDAVVIPAAAEAAA